MKDTLKTRIAFVLLGVVTGMMASTGMSQSAVEAIHALALEQLDI